MSKDNKISLKLEVVRDKTSKKLIITAHFDSKADNVFINKDSYSWMPTIEEHDLLNDAFAFFSVDGAVGSLGKTTVKTEDKKTDDKKEEIPEPLIQETKSPAEEEPVKEEEKPKELPPLENTFKTSIFKRAEKEPKIDEIDSEPALEINEQPKDEKNEDEKKVEEDAKIVEADGEAIQRALKKHTEADNDDSIVEADEEMIIEKVLSQKKKGKWAKK